MFPARSSAFFVASAAFFPHFPSTSFTDSIVSERKFQNHLKKFPSHNHHLQLQILKKIRYSLLTEDEGAGAGAGEI
jgi:hypothetical protein